MKAGFKILILVFMGVLLSACKYDELPPICHVEIEVTNLEVSYTTANISLGIVSNVPISEVSLEYALDSSFIVFEQVTMKKISLNNDSEKYNVTLESLKDGQTYYFRLCTYREVPFFVSETQQFTTKGYSLAQVRTDSISGVTTSSAIVYAKLLAWGTDTVPQVGFCIAQHTNVTIEDSCAYCPITGTEDSLAYCEIISRLKDNATYYIRSFAKNYKGVSYGEEMHFTTAEILLPTVGDVDFSDITYTTATCTSNIVSDGGVSVSSCGFCYSLSPNPTKDNNHKDSYSTKSPFTVTLSELTSGELYYVRAYATNIKGTSYGKEDSFRAKSYTEPLVITDENVQDITYTTALCGGSVKNNGGKDITECGVFYSLSTNPASFNHKQKGELKDDSTFTCNLSNLSAGKKYYFCAYAINEVGMDYGEEYSFTTMSPTLPNVTTADVTDITYTTAVCGGNVTDDGGQTIIERGICYSTSRNPTISDAKVSCGTGTGLFTCNISGLTASTTYYVRAYATNSKGIAYGSQVSLQTQVPSIPTVSTLRCIFNRNVICEGVVVSSNGAEISECGFCFSSTNSTPSISDATVIKAANNNTFLDSITIFKLSTKYYIRAYAKNSAGIGYGNMIEYTSPTAPTISIVSSSYYSIPSTGFYRMHVEISIPNPQNLNISQIGYFWEYTSRGWNTLNPSFTPTSVMNSNSAKVNCSFDPTTGLWIGESTAGISFGDSSHTYSWDVVTAIYVIGFYICHGDTITTSVESLKKK